MMQGNWNWWTAPPRRVMFRANLGRLAIFGEVNPSVASLSSG
jgi:hypothetical protein